MMKFVKTTHAFHALAGRLRDVGLLAYPDALLAEYGTFRLGGGCGLLVDCGSPADVIRAVELLRSAEIMPLFIGGGSNLLFSDAGYPGVLIRHFSGTPRIRRVSEELLEVDAGTVLDDLASFAVEQGLQGVEWLSGIPGTVGGAVAGNAGAWGRQIGDRLDSARILALGGEVAELQPEELQFAYRASRLQSSGEHLLSCRLRVSPGEREELLAERQRILEERARKHPDVRACPCIGSIFRNLDARSNAERRKAAGHLLEQAGAMEMRVGGAVVFPKHANIVIKGGEECTAQNVRDLIAQMREAVLLRFGVELRREVRYLGAFKHELGNAGFF